MHRSRNRWLKGELSASAQQALAELPKRDASSEESIAEPGSNLFQAAVASLEDLDGEPLWSAELEARNEPRFEVLMHRVYPEATILLAMLPGSSKLHGGGRHSRTVRPRRQ